jgi:transcriptional regulator with XRE-family HTH domain
MLSKLNPSFPGVRDSSLENRPVFALAREEVTFHSIDMRSSSTNSGLHSAGASNDSVVVLSPLGQKLRKARQRKGLDLHQVSSSLKISKRHINAIEEGKVDGLPAGNVYLIGYARAYAGYLGLNVAKCVEMLKAEIAQREASCEVVSAHSLSHRQEPLSAVRRALNFLRLGKSSGHI